MLISWSLLIFFGNRFYQNKTKYFNEKERFAYRYGLKYGFAVGFFDEKNKLNKYPDGSRLRFYEEEESYFDPGFTDFLWRAYHERSEIYLRDSTSLMNTYWQFNNSRYLEHRVAIWQKW